MSTKNVTRRFLCFTKSFIFHSLIFMIPARLLTSLNLSVHLLNCFYPELRNIIHLNFAYKTNSLLSSLITFDYFLCSQWLSSNLFLNCMLNVAQLHHVTFKNSCDKVHSYHTKHHKQFFESLLLSWKKPQISWKKIYFQ